MSPYKETILTFINLLESKAQLFSEADWQDLHKLADNLPENEEEISQKLQDWLKLPSREQMRSIFKESKKQLSGSDFLELKKNIGIAGSKSPTPPTQPSPASRELLINTIKHNSPLSQPETSQSSSAAALPES